MRKEGRLDTPTIRPMRTDEATECERILRALPEWFGIEESIREYARDLARGETLVAVRGAGPIGFLTLRTHNPRAAEIHVMGVRREHHGTGVGRALITRAERTLRERGVEYLQVKTLGPSRPSAEYARTRGFYVRVGFAPLEENRLWGDVNPCLILVKHLGCTARA